MNIKQFKIKIDEALHTLPLVNDITYGDVYSLWNNREMKYLAVNYIIEQAYVSDNDVQYTVYLCVGDRLYQDESNILEVHTEAENTIRLLLNWLKDNVDGLYVEDYTLMFYTQQFGDWLGGATANITITVPLRDDCVYEDFE